jgi:agmatinase
MNNLLKLLCPPGNGVFTVHTAQGKKNELHQQYYGVMGDAVQDQWIKSCEKSLAINKPMVLGVASDCGGGIQRGANWGPLFIRNHLLQFHPRTMPRFADLGDIRVIPHLLHDKYLNEKTLSECRAFLYGNDGNESQFAMLPVSPLSICEMACDLVYEHSLSKKIIALGGDHSVSYPLVKSFIHHKKKQQQKFALIHFDAHTDLLSQRMGIDHNFGTWAYHVLPLLNAPDDLIQIGIRSSGKDRTYWEKTFKHLQYWQKDLNTIGASILAKQIVDHLQKKNIQEIYISFDIDALDEQYASATGTPESSGMTPDQAITIIKILNQHFILSGADIVEVAPQVRSISENQSQIHSNEPWITLESASLIFEALLEGMENSNPSSQHSQLPDS